MISEQIDCKAVLWDVDGTLVDTTALIVGVLDSMYTHFTGKVVPLDEIRALIGIPLEKQVSYLGDPESFGTTMDDMKAFAVRGYERGRDQERIIPEVVDALIEIRRRGILTALVTSKSDIELANTLPRLGISAYCDIIVGADQVAPYFKPHPRPVMLALDLLGINSPTDAIFIGDSVHDMAAGRAAGTHIAGVLWGAATEQMLRAEMPNFLFARPEEIVPAILGEDGKARQFAVGVGS